MSVILILILTSLLMATVFLAAFIWSVRSGQYEDTITPSIRLLMEENGGQNPERAGDQQLSPTLGRGKTTRKSTARNYFRMLPTENDFNKP